MTIYIDVLINKILCFLNNKIFKYIYAMFMVMFNN